MSLSTGADFSQVVFVVKNLPVIAGDSRDRFNLWVRIIFWRRKWQPAPVFLPGESHGQRSLAGYSPWGCRVRHDLATKQQQQDIRVAPGLLSPFVLSSQETMTAWVLYGYYIWEK